jgi:putative phosphoribosyl transferase
MAAKRLPDRPHPEHYRRQAKDLRSALAAAEPAAVARLSQFHPRAVAAGDARLADAQLVLAREHGFASWPLLMAALREAAGNGSPGLPACEAGPLAVDTIVPEGARGIVLFLLAGRVGPRHAGARQVAERLRRDGYGTVMPSLLTEAEVIADAISDELAFDVPLLARRAEIVLDWIGEQPSLARLPLALLCAGTGTAAGIALAAGHAGRIGALVSCGGRPDLAGAAAARLRAPSLFVVGGDDAVALGFTRLLLEIVPRDVPSRLSIADGVGLRFDEGPAAARAAELAIAWLDEQLVAGEAA